VASLDTHRGKGISGGFIFVLYNTQLYLSFAQHRTHGRRSTRGRLVRERATDIMSRRVAPDTQPILIPFCGRHERAPRLVCHVRRPSIPRLLDFLQVLDEVVVDQQLRHRHEGWFAATASAVLLRANAVQLYYCPMCVGVCGWGGGE